VSTGEFVGSVQLGEPRRRLLRDEVHGDRCGIERAPDDLGDLAVSEVDARSEHTITLVIPGPNVAADTLRRVTHPTTAATRTLSESESKRLLAGAGVPIAAEAVVDTALQAVAAASSIGYPVVVKLNGDAIAHKTERGLVRLNLTTPEAVEAAGNDLLAKATPTDGPVGLLVAPLVRGNRELIAGVATDPQFGPTVMVGIGGIFAEALADVAFRLVPLTRVDADDMVDDLATQALLGAFRGEPAVDREALIDVLVGLSRLIEQRPDIVSVDVNPLIVSATDGKPIAVDGLVEVAS
jgi:succinyl-CoA synthetase beta subunit